MKKITVKTLLGYLKTLVGKYTPLKMGDNHIEGIYNYRPYSDTLSSSGQPTEDQFACIKQAGFTTVINLAPLNAENSLKDEAGTLSDLGLSYIHIPVDFKNPTEQDFQRFIECFSPLQDSKTWVHCAANMRVSAFLYRYRRDILNLPEAEARKVMDTIWAPFGNWKTFLD